MEELFPDVLDTAILLHQSKEYIYAVLPDALLSELVQDEIFVHSV
jgi:hypothetical protein